MTAYNVVRFRVKPGREMEFMDAFKGVPAGLLPGSRKMVVVKTGDNSYCSIGEWDAFNSIANARPIMISLLDTFRDCLEDLGGGLGVSDPISGEAILEFGAPAAAAKPKSRAQGKKRAKPAAKKAAKKSAKKAAKKKPAKRAKRRAKR